jgi:hypothetical protein
MSRIGRTDRRLLRRLKTHPNSQRARQSIRPALYTMCRTVWSANSVPIDVNYLRFNYFFVGKGTYDSVTGGTLLSELTSGLLPEHCTIEKLLAGLSKLRLRDLDTWPYGFNPGIFSITLVMMPSLSFISAIRVLLRATFLFDSAIPARVFVMFSFVSSMFALDFVTLA